MRLLALDIGSSSVKAAVLVDGALPRRNARVRYPTHFDGTRASVRLADIESAVRAAIERLGQAARRADLIAPATMSPSWVALDARGRALTDVVTHQDRRSVAIAHDLERRVGRARHLRLAGNRPFPGGISSTTWAWHLAHDAAALRRAALVGHLGTWLGFALAGARAIDTSNAGFTGLLDVRRLAWSDELIDAAGVDRDHLPEVVESNTLVGRVTAGAARRFGLTAGTPLLAGCIDGSAAMLAAGARVGQLVNVCGSTDVLAQLADAPRPHADLLTRPLGVGRRWLSVGTIAAAGTAIDWTRRTLYADRSAKAFYATVAEVASADSGGSGGSSEGRSARRVAPKSVALRFAADLAGSRTAMDAVAGRLDGLTLATTRDDVLRALVDDLAARSAARLDTLAAAGLPPPLRDVLMTGGLGTTLADALHRAWPRGFRFRTEDEATLRGLWALASNVAV